MKNAAFLILALLLFAALPAQVVLDESVEPVPGDAWKARMLDTTGLTEGPGGSAQVWDFSGINLVDSLNIFVIPASDSPNPDSFPNSHIALSYDASEYRYFDTLGNTFTYHGTYNASSSVSIPFHDGQDRLDFPLSFGKTWQDSFSGQFTLLGSTHYLSGTLSGEVDGEGVLIEPDGNSISNVLRVRVLEDLKDSSGSGSNWTVTTTQNRYFQWWVAGHRFPLIDMEFVEANVGGPVVQVQETWWIGLQAVDREEDRSNLALECWPNPGREQVHFRFPADAPWKLTLLDLHGRELLFSAGTGRRGQMQVRALPEGIYLIRAEQEGLQGHLRWHKH